MTKCEHCGYQFHSALHLSADCPKCKLPYRRTDDDGFDATGFAIGMATGVPISPTQGVSLGSMIGAALHNSGEAHATPAPDSTPSPSESQSYSSPDSSSSYDSGSSSGGFDSGGSGFDSGSSGFSND